MTRAHRFAALPLVLAGALMVLAAGPAAAQGRDAVSGIAADVTLPQHADALRIAAKDDRRGDRSDWRHDRRDHRADRRHDRRDHRADARHDRRDWHKDRREWEKERRKWEKERHAYHREYHRDRRDAYRHGYRDGRRHYTNRWGYRPGYYVPRERYVVVREYHRYGYAPPPRGHAYVRIDSDVFLVALATGLIVSSLNR